MAPNYTYNGDGTWTVVFDIGSGLNDRFVYRRGGSYPPPAPTDQRVSTNNLTIRKSFLGNGIWENSVGLLKWNTSSLPDDAEILSADLRVRVVARNDSNSRQLRIQRSNWTADVLGAYNNDVPFDLASFPLSNIPAGEFDIQLDSFVNPDTYIDRQGNFEIRIGVSGGSPTGENRLVIHAAETSFASAPRLVLTYRREEQTVSVPRLVGRGVAHAPDIKPQEVAIRPPKLVGRGIAHAPAYVGLVVRPPKLVGHGVVHPFTLSGGQATIQLPKLTGRGIAHTPEVLLQPVTIEVPKLTGRGVVRAFRLERQLKPLTVRRRTEALMLSGERGSINYKPYLFLSNINAEEVGELPGVMGAEVNLSNYRDHTWELSLECEDSDAWNPLSDWVLAAMDISTAMDPVPIRYYLGLYRFFLPEADDQPEGRYWTLSGQSPEMLLASDVAVSGWRVAAGANVMDAVRDLLTSVGIPASRITLPPSTKTIPNGLYFDPIKDGEKAKKIRIVNHLLSIAGYEAIQTTKRGQFFAVESQPLSKREPTVHYGDEHDDMILRVGIPRRANTDRFANEILVTSQDPNQDPRIFAVARDTDPNSPISVLPSGLGYSVTEHITRPTLTDQETADRIAATELERSAAYQEVRTIQTMLDPRRGPGESYEADAYNAKEEHILDGKWGVVNWRMPLNRNDPGEMTHEMSRTARFQEAL